MMNGEKAPYHIAQNVMLYFFDVVHMRRKTMHDISGEEALGLLVGTLNAINAPTLIWGQVTDFVLEQARKRSAIFYEGVLCSLAEYVSAPKLAEIIDHFVGEGRLETVAKLTTTYLHRGPSFVEVARIAKAHCNEHTWTNPKDKVWGQLLSLAHKGDVPAIQKLHEEAKRRQHTSDHCIY
ncbi:MAG: hypothetical protein WC791_03870 [Candidatus Paceibacterota bacterium]